MSADSITSVGILGSGIMGAGLVEVAARSGRTVVLRSRTQDGADAAIAKLAKGLTRQVDKGRLDGDERDAILGRISATSDIDALADCDLVVESVVEDLPIKKALFAELDAVVKAGAVLATNTSTLPVVELAMATQRPELVCGIHFFNPAPMMKLVEVVRPITASDETIATALAFASSCGKDEVEVVDRARLSSSTPCSSRTSTTRSGCGSRALRRWRRSTPRCRAVATSRWVRSRSSTSSALDTVARHPRSTPHRVRRPELHGRHLTEAPGRSGTPRPQDRSRIQHLLNPSPHPNPTPAPFASSKTTATKAIQPTRTRRNRLNAGS